MPVKAVDLISFVGKQAIVQIDTSHESSDEDFKEITCKILAAGPTGLVIQTKTGSQIIAANLLMDLEEIIPATTRRLTRRWIREASVTDARQHLVDRHGLPLSIVQLLKDAEALEMHKNTDHADRGHSHGEKPRKRRGRPRTVTEDPTANADGAGGADNTDGEDSTEDDFDILECDSCGYQRHVEADGREMKPVPLGGYHCAECFDPDGD